MNISFETVKARQESERERKLARQKPRSVFQGPRKERKNLSQGSAASRPFWRTVNWSLSQNNDLMPLYTASRGLFPPPLSLSLSHQRSNGHDWHDISEVILEKTKSPAHKIVRKRKEKEGRQQNWSNDSRLTLCNRQVFLVLHVYHTNTLSWRSFSTTWPRVEGA